LEDAIKQIDEMMTEIEIQSTSTENSICTAFNQIRKIIEERESALLNELDQIQKVKKKELGLQKDDLKFGIESIKGCCSLTAKTLEKASDIEVFLSTKQMVTRLKYLQNAKWKSKPIQDSFINFSFFNKETKILSEIPKLGIITTNHADPGECQLDGVYDLMRKQLQVNYPVTFTITAFSKDGRRITKGGEKFMVSITGDEETQHDAVIFFFFFFSFSFFSFFSFSFLFLFFFLFFLFFFFFFFLYFFLFFLFFSFLFLFFLSFLFFFFPFFHSS